MPSTPHNRSVIVQIQQALGLSWDGQGQIYFSFDQPVVTLQKSTDLPPPSNEDLDAPANKHQDGGPELDS